MFQRTVAYSDAHKGIAAVCISRRRVSAAVQGSGGGQAVAQDLGGDRSPMRRRRLTTGGGVRAGGEASEK